MVRTLAPPRCLTLSRRHTGVVEHLRRDQLSGKLDPAVFAAFAHGACDAFAVALHDLTGWPLVKVTDPWNVSGPEDRWGIGVSGGGSAVHWVVVTPDGRLVDVHGAHFRENFSAQFDAYVDAPTDDDVAAGITAGARLGYATRADALAENEAKTGELTEADALVYARAVLDELETP